MRGSIGARCSDHLDASNHRPSGNVSGSAVRDRDAPIGDFFPKKEKRSGQAAARNGFRSNLEVCISALAHALHIEVD